MREEDKIQILSAMILFAWRADAEAVNRNAAFPQSDRMLDERTKDAGQRAREVAKMLLDAVWTAE